MPSPLSTCYASMTLTADIARPSAPPLIDRKETSSALLTLVGPIAERAHPGRMTGARLELEAYPSTFSVRFGDGRRHGVCDPFKRGTAFLACDICVFRLRHRQAERLQAFSSWLAREHGKQCLDHAVAHSSVRSLHCKPPAGSGDDGVDADARFAEIDDGVDGAGHRRPVRADFGIVRLHSRQGGMEGFIKSLIRFSWAISLFGARQLANALPPRDPAGAFDAVTRAANARLDGFISGAFKVGDRIQRGMVDWLCDTLTPDAFTPRRLTRKALVLMQRSAEAIRSVSPAEQLAWQEFQNKLQAFSLFEHVDMVLSLPSHASLAEMVGRAAALEPFRSVWAIEGVGHHYTELACARGEAPRGLLTDEE